MSVPFSALRRLEFTRWAQVQLHLKMRFRTTRRSFNERALG